MDGKSVIDITFLSLWAHKLFRSDEPQPFSGAELQLYTLARELAKRPDVKIHFITRGRGAAEAFNSEGIRVIKLPYRSTHWGRSLIGSGDIVRGLLSLPGDILIQRGGGYETGLTGWVARRKRKPFLFMTSHDWDVDGTHAEQRGWLYRLFYLYGLNHAARVVTQSQFQADLLRQNHQKASVVLRSAHRIPESVSAERRGGLWISRCEPWKRPETLIRLAAALPQIPITMICPEAGSRDYFHRIREQASQQKNITFLPGVPFDATEQWFSQSRVFICTSEKEGFPNTYVQAFKWGIPVISLFINPDQVLHNRQIGICTEGNEIAQKEIVQRLLAHPDEWREYSRRARDYAVEHHDVQRIAKKLYDLIQEIVNSSR